MYVNEIILSYVSKAKVTWGDFRDHIILEDLERSLNAVRESPNNGTYITADFMFVQASFAFARGEIERGGKLCRGIDQLHPGYDPSQRFYLRIPSEIKDTEKIIGIAEEVIQLRIAENFLSRFLKTHNDYNFSHFSEYFKLQEPISRQCLIERLGMEKD